MRKYFLLFAFAITALRMFALETASGQLEFRLNSQGESAETSLTLTGTMDARDFKYISENLTDLETLDISGVTITEYSDKKPLFGNFVLYPANEFPKYSMMGMRLKKVELPTGMTAIGEGAFAGCASLESVNLPVTVTEIGDYAFSGAPRLTAVAGGDAVSRIGTSAFSHCRQLSTLPAFPCVTAIEAYAFVDCPALSAFTFPTQLTIIGEGAFKETSLALADLSKCNRLQAIGAWAFADNDKLLAAVFPQSMTSVGEGAFFYNTALQKLNFPVGVAKVEDFTFMGTQTAIEAALPEGVTEIGSYSFFGNSGIADFLIPSTVGCIGERAFGDWTALTVLRCEAAVPPTTGENVWYEIEKANVQLIVPETSETLYRTADQWKDFFNSSALNSLTDSEIKAYCSNDLLSIESGKTISEVSLYDLSGIMLARRKPNAETATFDLSGLSGKVYIVVCRLENGKTEYLKIARR